MPTTPTPRSKSPAARWEVPKMYFPLILFTFFDKKVQKKHRFFCNFGNTQILEIWNFLCSLMVFPCFFCSKKTLKMAKYGYFWAALSVQNFFPPVTGKALPADTPPPPRGSTEIPVAKFGLQSSRPRNSYNF